MPGGPAPLAVALHSPGYPRSESRSERPGNPRRWPLRSAVLWLHGPEKTSFGTCEVGRTASPAWTFAVESSFSPDQAAREGRRPAPQSQICPEGLRCCQVSGRAIDAPRGPKHAFRSQMGTGEVGSSCGSATPQRPQCRGGQGLQHVKYWPHSHGGKSENDGAGSATREKARQGP